METTKEAEVVVSDELDISFINSIGSSLAELLADDDIHPELVRRVGPAGGWPVYRFHGTRVAIGRLYTRYYDLTTAHEYWEALDRLDVAEPSTL